MQVVEEFKFEIYTWPLDIMVSCKKCCVVSVGLFAVLLGLLIGGFLQPLFTYQDSYVGSRGTTKFKGLFPVHHKGIPWGFTHAHMPNLEGVWDGQDDCQP